VYEALETLEKQMLEEDRVPPTQYVFTVLIGVLGRVGYTKKAFDIFNKVRSLTLFNFETRNQSVVTKAVQCRHDMQLILTIVCRYLAQP